VVGRVQGRNKMKKLVDGNVAGKFAFDLTGYIAKADLAITTEASLFGDLQVISVFDIKLVRMPGNPLNIALPVKTGPGPGVPPPKGDVIVQLNSTLGPQDPLDSEFGQKGTRMKVVPVKFEAGKKYSILLNSTAFDSYLRLFGPNGQVLAKDDDGGGDLNARIDHIASMNGDYRIEATAFDGKQGAFQLKVIRWSSIAGDTPVANPEKFTKPAASPKPVSSFRLVSSPGEFIGQGKAYAFPPQAMIIKKTDRGVQVSVAGFNVQIGAPRGQFLEKKEYQGAKRYAFSDTAPGLDVTGPGRGASNVFGAFVVWELEMQGNNITRLAIDFVQRSERPTNPPLTGKIRWNSRLQ